MRLDHELAQAEFSYRNIHFPESFQALELARRRLTFEELFYLSAGLAMLTGHGSSVTPYGVVMAGALISALPLLIVFFFVQKRFVEGIAMTGMK